MQKTIEVKYEATKVIYADVETEEDIQNEIDDLLLDICAENVCYEINSIKVDGLTSDSRYDSMSI